MALAKWHGTITDLKGNVLPHAQIYVVDEASGGVPQLFSDRNGTVGLSNPFNADDEGFAGFHVVGGAYRITARLGAYERVWRYVGIGTAQETDIGEFGSGEAGWDAIEQTPAGLANHTGSAVGFRVLVVNAADNRAAIYEKIGAGASWSNPIFVTGSQGAPGAANELVIGSVVEGAAGATITGSVPQQVLNLSLPRGDDGVAGPPNVLDIGTVTGGSEASATITGVAPSQQLNLVLPRGPQGEEGPSGPMGDVTPEALAAKADAEAARDAAIIAKGDAESSATSAATSASTATDKASDASNSAAAALASENAASGSASDAAASASAASSSESSAASSATTAYNQAGIATTQASNASSSASDAAASASAASSSASSASTDAGLASNSASDAASSAAAAAASEQSVADDSLAAQNAASDAANSATTATTQAGIATTKASEAAGSATDAGNSASAASNSATSAAGSASTATTKASEAVSSATDAAASATTASNKAGEASASATSASSSATSAGNSASDAAGSASTAVTKAGEASASAASALSSKDDAQAANTAAQSAKTSAETASTQAASSASAAAGSATSAGNSASAASGSASTASSQAGIATTAAIDAETARDYAYEWSSADVDDPVNDGVHSGFSAYHWSVKAQIAAGGGVQSVNGYTGPDVVLTASDVGAATSAQGAKADSAVQTITAGSNITVSKSGTTYTVNATATPQVQTDWNATSGLGQILNKPVLGTAAAQNVGYFATAAQGSKADTALQTLTAGTAITISGTGTSRTINAVIPAQVQSDWNASSGVAQILNKPTLGTASAQNVGYFATAAQGSKADTALQTLTQGANITITGTGTTRTIAATVPPPPVTSVNSKTGAVVLNAGDVGALPSGGKAADSSLLNGQNAAQLPVSTATQTALNGKQNSLGFTPVNKAGDTGLGGYTSSSVNDGVKSSGTYTPAPTNSNFREITNGGNFTLVAPTAAGSYNLTIDITNNASAGAITFTGFAPDNPKGDDLTATNGHKFKLHISKTSVGVTAQIEALQ